MPSSTIDKIIENAPVASGEMTEVSFERLKKMFPHLKNLKLSDLKKTNEEPKEEVQKITKKEIKKKIKELFDEDKITEKKKDKLLEQVSEKDYEPVLKYLKKKGVVFGEGFRGGAVDKPLTYKSGDVEKHYRAKRASESYETFFKNVGLVTKWKQSKLSPEEFYKSLSGKKSKEPETESDSSSESEPEEKPKMNKSTKGKIPIVSGKAEAKKIGKKEYEIDTDTSINNKLPQEVINEGSRMLRDKIDDYIKIKYFHPDYKNDKKKYRWV